MSPLILIVDDEEGFRHILQLVLQRAGLMTQTARNVHEARALIECQMPHCIILDDMMPGMTGSEYCVELKHDPKTAHIPVIMHSAAQRVRNDGYLERIGADAALYKPSSPREIVETVEQQLALIAPQP